MAWDSAIDYSKIWWTWQDAITSHKKYKGFTTVVSRLRLISKLITIVVEPRWLRRCGHGGEDWNIKNFQRNVTMVRFNGWERET